MSLKHRQCWECVSCVCVCVCSCCYADSYWNRIVNDCICQCKFCSSKYFIVWKHQKRWIM